MGLYDSYVEFYTLTPKIHHCYKSRTDMSITYYRNWEDCILTIEEESTETNEDEEEAVDCKEEEASDVSDPDDDDEEGLAAEEEED